MLFEIWRSRGLLVRPSNGIIAVDTIFDLHMVTIAIVTREIVLCHSLRPVRPDIHVQPFKPFVQLVSYAVTFSSYRWYTIWHWLVVDLFPTLQWFRYDQVTPVWLPGHAIYLWCFLTSRRHYVFRWMYLVRISQCYWSIGPAHQCLRTVCTRHGC